MLWVIRPKRLQLIDAEEIIICGNHGEDFLLADLEKQINQRIRSPRNPQHALYLDAISVALEHWLDLRRDECDAQPDDLQRHIATAFKLTIQNASLTNQ